MARWLASDVPEWLTGALLILLLPALMVLVQFVVHRRAPHWRSGENNDVAGIMLSAAVVVYSVAIGLCVVTLWEKLDEARRSTEAEATNLVAMVTGAQVFGTGVQEQIRAGVIAYNQAVVDSWPQLVLGDGSSVVRGDLAAMVTTVGGLQPRTEAQRAYVDDAMARLASAAELRATAVRLAQEKQLPDVFWVAVLGGSAIVLGLSLTCGVRDRTMRRILLAGVTATVGINLFLVIELNFPFLGQLSIGPDSYRDVIASLHQR